MVKDREAFLRKVSEKVAELNSLIEEGDDTKSLLFIAAEDYKDGSIGFIHSLSGLSSTIVDSIVEFMKTNRGNIIWQAVRQTEQNKLNQKK